MVQRNYSRYHDTVIINDGVHKRNGIRGLIDTTPKSDDVYYIVKDRDRIDNISYNTYGRAYLS